MNKQRRHTTQQVRSGAAMVEGAIVLSLVFLLLLGMLDQGIAVLQSNLLAESARRLAREAGVRGVKSAPARTAWGPAPRSGHAADGSEPALLIRPILAIGNPAQVTYSITWPDSTNNVGDSVRVALTWTRPSLLPFDALTGDYQFAASSTSQILH